MKPISLRFQLNALFILIVLSMTLVLGVSTYLRDRADQFQTLNAQSEAALGRLSASLPAAVWDMDNSQALRLMTAEMGSTALNGIVIVKGGKVIAGIGRGAQGGLESITTTPQADASLGTELNWTHDGKQEPLGRVELSISHAELYAKLRARLVTQALTVSACGAAMLVLLSFAFSSLVLKPLNEVEMALADIGSGKADLTKHLMSGRSTEFEGIARGFNRFVDHLDGVVFDVRRRSESLSTGIQEIAAGNDDLSHRTEVQAAIVQQSAQAVSQLTRLVAEHNGSAEQANKTAGQANELARQSGEVMSGVVKVIGEISASSKRITEIINVIDGISFQTNILALNAAVEAARAGEQGRGFAVVASEVRALAGRSASAAKEIKALISDSVEKVERGQQQVLEGGGAIAAVTAAVQRVNVLVGEMAQASNQQNDQIGHLNEAMTRIDQTTQQNSALVEQVAAAASSVRDATRGLVDTVAEFNLQAR